MWEAVYLNFIKSPKTIVSAKTAFNVNLLHFSDFLLVARIKKNSNNNNNGKPSPILSMIRNIRDSCGRTSYRYAISVSTSPEERKKNTQILLNPAITMSKKTRIPL